MVAMRRWFARVKEQADTILALLLAIVVSVLGVADVVSAEVVNNAILVTLAVLAFSLLRDRWRKQESTESITAKFSELVHELDETLGKLRELRDVGSELSPVRELLRGMTEVEVLVGAAIGRAFAEARRSCAFWEFKGGTGTYLRAKTLPELARLSRLRSRPIRVRVDILDPTNFELCDSYARYQQQIAHELWPQNNGEGSGRNVQLSCLATILAALRYNRGSLLEIELSLSSVWSNQRFDRCEECLLITVRDKSWPAYRIRSRTKLHADYLTHLSVSFRQGRAMNLAATDAPLADVPGIDETRYLFDRIGLSLRLYTDEEVAYIVQQALTPSNPYGG
ncbi:hypothetical protein ACIHFD_04645 [Nonomuraea sp. NPDC051941]|uniref:hypothetical protein n=1 Tax=Nonomuraea sp. NPDC051941 TaxID=3364373 RepID=UPI0037C8A3BB